MRTSRTSTCTASSRSPLPSFRRAFRDVAGCKSWVLLWRWRESLGAVIPKRSSPPFVIRPDGRVPGEWYKRATNFELAGRVHNLLVSCFDGRPQHIEPNVDHPAKCGMDASVQAAMLSLYDPDRSRGDDGPLLNREGPRKKESQWEDFLPVGQAAIKKAASNQNGKGFALLMSPTASPTLVSMVNKLRETLPAATIARFDGVGNDVMRAATKQMFGREAKQVLDLSKAKVILTLEADILGSDPCALHASKTYAENRDPSDHMSRMYVVEGGFSTTGTMADSRLALRPSQMPAFLAELGRTVDSLKGGETHDHAGEEGAFNEITASARLERFLDCLAHDIVEAGGDAVVVVGESLGADVVAAGIAMNQKIGSLGKAQKFIPLVDSTVENVAGLGELVASIDAGDIETLLILGDNPVVTTPGDIDMISTIEKVDSTIYLGEYDDETAAVCDWSLPLAHPLESWSDCVNDHGDYGVCQPQILPLMGGRTAAEVLALMLDESTYDSMELVRATAEGIRWRGVDRRRLAVVATRRLLRQIRSGGRRNVGHRHRT